MTVRPPLTATRGAIQRLHVQRSTHPSTHAWMYRLVALCLALGVSALALNEFGTASGSPLTQTVHTTFGTSFGLQTLIILAGPLILTGAAVTLALRVGLWNIGGEGQLFAGAWVATGIAFALPSLSAFVLLPIMLIGAMIGGALWVLLPAIARVYVGVSEVVTTLMLNFVMVLWTTYWAVGPWADPESHGTIASLPITPNGWLPNIMIKNWPVNSSIVIAVGIIIAIAIAFRGSIWGYRSVIVGGSQRAGVYAGINVRRHFVVMFLAAGALAGLGGGIDLMGSLHTFSPELSNNTGYIGIAVGVLAGGSFLAVGVMGIIIAGVLSLAESAQFVGVSSQAGFVVIGIILLLTALVDVLSYYRVFVLTRVPVVESIAGEVSTSGEGTPA